MRNLLIYVNPARKFDKEQGILAKIQIENNLELGQDFLLVTNFNHKYLGVKSMVVPDSLYYPYDKTSCKMPVISYLLKHKLISGLWWYHDLDVYQLVPLPRIELKCDLGLTSYTYRKQWQCGSFFFREGAEDIFTFLTDYMYCKQKGNRADERLLTRATIKNYIKPERYEEMNVTYNFAYKHTDILYRVAEKPIKAIHFNPWEVDPLAYTPKVLDIMMYGKNEIQTPLMNKRLIKLFKRHKIQ